jgi:uncharacterized membrane protein
MFRIPFLLAAIGLASSLAAQTLTGRIVDSNNLPVVGATVYCDLSPTIRANTDALGNFTITSALGLRNDRYDIAINPRNPSIAPLEYGRVQVSGATNLGTVQLAPGTQITATLVGPTGLPLVGANLSAFDPTGLKLYTPNDGTDVNGNARIVVPYGPLTFRAMPPVGTTLVALQEDVTITGPLAYGTITMRQGYALTGSIVRSGATPLPISNCEILATNMLTGESMFLANKRTNTLGAFNILLPFGIYQLELLPALGAPYAAREVFGIPVIDYSYSLGLVPMDPGVALSGTVRGPTGLAVAGADIDVYTSNGHKLYTPNDNTTPTGTFSVMVPTGGTYTVQVDPLVASNLIGATSAPVVVNAATNAGIITVASGVPATITVLDVFGGPAAKAQMSVRNATTGEEYVVPGNSAGADGVIRAVIPQGNLDIRVKAQQGSFDAPLVLPPSIVAGPLVTTVQLQPKTMSTNTQGLGILTVPNGGEIFLRWTIMNLTPQVQFFTVEASVPLPSGVEVPWVPAIPLDMPGPLGVTLDFWIATPPVPASELKFLQKLMVRIRDAATTQLLDESYVYFVPQ